MAMTSLFIDIVGNTPFHSYNLKLNFPIRIKTHYQSITKTGNDADSLKRISKIY